MTSQETVLVMKIQENKTTGKLHTFWNEIPKPSFISLMFLPNKQSCGIWLLCVNINVSR